MGRELPPHVCPRVPCRSFWETLHLINTLVATLVASAPSVIGGERRLQMGHAKPAP